LAKIVNIKKMLYILTMLKNTLSQDSKIAELIGSELNRQKQGLELIASENFVSVAVLEAMGTVLANKYSEGYPGRRFYGGNEFIDQIETLAIERAKTLFKADHANVQPHSGSTANLEAYYTLLNLGDKILAMDMSCGGHLTHGSAVSFSSKFYNFVFYKVDKKTHLINYNEVREIALREKPKLIIAGASAYPRIIDFKKFSEIAKEVGAYFMADIAHIAGLIITGLHPNPVPYADIVTTTTHKTLRGPRGAIILCQESWAEKLDKAVMPGLQGGPLEHIIAAKAVAFNEALQPEFKTYQKQILKNSKALAKTLLKEDFVLISGGTDNHLILIDLTNFNITGKQAETALEQVNIYTNKNLIPYDPRKPLNPSGLRIGTPALTTRGFKEREMEIVGELIAKILKNIDSENIKKEVKNKVGELAKNFPLYPKLI
jgi:glycine hydroxymethyltransferase